MTGNDAYASQILGGSAQNFHETYSGIHVFVSNIHADTSDIDSLHPHHETSLLLAFAIHPKWHWTVVLYCQC